MTLSVTGRRRPTFSFGTHRFLKGRFVTIMQVAGIALMASIVALSSLFTPAYAASNTALKWTPQTVPLQGYQTIAWSPQLGLFAATSLFGANIITSPDGKTWTQHSIPLPVELNGITWSATLGKFLALNQNGYTFSSTDGSTWVQTNPNPIQAGNTEWQAVTWSPTVNLFVAVACGVGNTGCDTNAGNRIATSPDGITWTTRSAPGNLQLWNIDWSSNLGLFVATDGRGSTTQSVLTSPDGITWTQRTTPAGPWSGLAYSPTLNRYVSVSMNGGAMTSSDAITWTARTTPEANQWLGVAWSPQLNLFVATASSGTHRVMTSPDGITWTAQAAATNNAWNDVKWSPTLQTFVSVSSDGFAMTGSMVTATTTAPSNISETTATLQGTYTDAYPANATVFFRYRVAGSGGAFTSTSPQPANATNTYSANIGGLTPNTTYEYQIVAQWPSANGTQEVTGNLTNFTTAFSKVHYRKTVSPDPTSITPGQTFTYTVTVQNQGTTAMNGLSFTDDLSDVVDDATYGNDVASSIGTATWDGSSKISWNGDLSPGQTATITYTVTMNTPDTGNKQLLNGVVGTGTGSNCTASPAIDPECRTTSPLPDVTSTKTLVGPTNPTVGDTVNYKFTIKNDGVAAATNVAVADDLNQVLDDAAYNNDAQASTGTITYNPTSKRIIWNGNLAASGSASDTVTVTYSVKVNSTDKIGDALLNNAIVSPDCPLTPVFDASAPGYKANCVTSTRVTVPTASLANTGENLGLIAAAALTLAGAGVVFIVKKPRVTGKR